MFFIFYGDCHFAAPGCFGVSVSPSLGRDQPMAALRIPIAWLGCINLTVYLISVYQLILISQSEMTGATE